MSEQFNATAYAARLGVTREVFPEWFVCTRNVFANGVVEDWICNLPSPDSDDPRACLWFYFLWMACGCPEVHPEHGGGFVVGRTQWINSEESEWLRIASGATPTAALAAAFDAKEAK